MKDLKAHSYKSTTKKFGYFFKTENNGRISEKKGKNAKWTVEKIEQVQRTAR